MNAIWARLASVLGMSHSMHPRAGCTGHGADRLAGVPASGLSAAVRGEWHCRHRDSFLTVANWSHTAVARAEHVVDDRPENQAVGLSPHLQAAVALVERMGDPGIARIRNRLLWKRHGRNLVSAKESTSVAALVLDSKDLCVAAGATRFPNKWGRRRLERVG